MNLKKKRGVWGRGGGRGGEEQTSGALLWAIRAPPCLVGTGASVHCSIPGTEVVLLTVGDCEVVAARRGVVRCIRRRAVAGYMGGCFCAVWPVADLLSEQDGGEEKGNDDIEG